MTQQENPLSLSADLLAWNATQKELVSLYADLCVLPFRGPLEVNVSGCCQVVGTTVTLPLKYARVSEVRSDGCIVMWMDQSYLVEPQQYCQDKNAFVWERVSFSA